jgi:pyruvate formate lyase activating enzyme
MKGMVFNIQRYSVDDGPGIRTTVFLKGCPLRCKWCHNPESISPKQELVLHENRCLRCGDCMTLCKNNAIISEDGKFVTLREFCLACGTCIELCYAEAREIVGKEMTTEEVMVEIEKDVVFFDESGGGVTFSGGEPLLQHEFLVELLEECGKKNIHRVVDTTGFTSASILERVSRSVDLFLYDLKTLDDEKHRAYTGVSNRLILENLRRLAKWNKKVIVRIPIIPGINDDPENIRQTGLFVASLGNISEVQLLAYHKTGIEKYHRLGAEYRLEEVAAPSTEDLDDIACELRNHIPVVSY